MAKKKVGRPSKIDVDTMNSFNVFFIIIIIILIMLLSVGIMSIIDPHLIDMIKASLANLFK